MLYTVHIDESGTHDGAHAMILSGHVARLGQWTRFDKQWRKLLREEGLTHHHAVDAVHSSGEYKGWDARRIRRYLNKAQKLIHKHILFGFVIRITEENYRQYYAAEKLKGQLLDTMYSLCFRICVYHVAELLVRSYPDEDQEIHFVLEDGAEGIGDTDRVYRELKKLIDQNYLSILGPRTIADKKSICGLQAADHLAYSAYKVEAGTPDLIDMQGGETLQQASELVRNEPPIHRIDVNTKVLSDFRAAIEHAWKRKTEWEAIKKEARENGRPLPPRRAPT